ncbi:MAG: type VI secretion system tip protein VgrG, partial [Gammaproteobacteria bacterium]|nr:type VI secretion system tip protein VgrG [Gammaproteobacteria bacterium]
MSNLTQDQRLLSIKSPLAKDELLLTSFVGTEFISDLFEFQIEVLSSNHSIKPDELIGKTASITVENDIKRSFNGYISSFTYGEIKSDNLRTYRMTMVPWLWFLSKNNNHRIFQNKTTKDIVMQVFDDLGFNDFDFKATGNSVSREYCVQYNESDLSFISRLLEEEGIAYFFEHKEDSHIMHIVDEANAYQDCAETDLTYSKGTQPNTQIMRWEHVHEFRKGKWSLNDYDFKQPTKSQLQTTASTSKFANAQNYEHYEYSPYHDFSGIKDLTKKRIEAEEAPMNIIEASSDCSSFYAGGKFKLAKHAVSSEQGTYIITAINHHAVDNSYLSGHDSISEYGNDFTCIPDSVHFRPPLENIKPIMQGPQSALVVGPSGEEIYIDEYGRIK